MKKELEYKGILKRLCIGAILLSILFCFHVEANAAAKVKSYKARKVTAHQIVKELKKACPVPWMILVL